MKKRTVIIGFVVLLAYPLIFSCNKETEIITPFPPNTETGANTFMFRVNGGEIINSQVGYFAAKPRISIYYSQIEPVYGSYFFDITSGILFLADNKFISITVKEMPTIGKYDLSSGNSGASYDDENPTELHYYTDVNNTGELNITKLDTINHIISGTFTFKARQWCLNGNCNGVVTIDGQFDVTYKPNNRVNYY